MPKTQLVFYQEEDGTVPFLEWLDGLPAKAKDKSRVKIERLAALGYELRRPEADYLRDGIYEPRFRIGRVNYRILYFFHLDIAAVLSHGLVKERLVTRREIVRALEQKRKFGEDPEGHTYQEG